MKIALTQPYSWPEVRRGGERLLAETARGLAHRGHAVTVFTAGSRSLREHDGGLTTVKFRRRLSDAYSHERWFGVQIAPYLVAGRFDVVHSLMPHDCGTAIATRPLAGHRAVFQGLGLPERAGWNLRRDRRAHERLVDRVDAYLCVSRHALELLGRDFGRTGELLPAGVRLADFEPAPTRQPRPTLLYSGIVDEPRKGVAVLLQALALVAREVPDITLWLSGPGDAGPLLAGAPAAARERTEVLPLGEPRELADRYGRAWLTVHPARFESFGIVLLESLACGTPVVAADDSALPELVTPETGTLCRPEDAESLRDAILRALPMAHAAGTVSHCRRVASGLDWDTAIIPRLEKVYSGLLQAP